MITVLQIVKRYTGAYPLFDEMFRLDPQHFRVIVCYLGGEQSGKHVLDGQVARIVYLGRRSGQMRWYNLALLKSIGEIIDQEQVDIVCCQLHRTLPVGLGGCLVARRKPALVSTIHGLAGRQRWIRRAQNRILHGRVDRVVAISFAVAADLRKNNPWLPEEKIVTIQNGLDFSSFKQEEDQVALRRELFPEIDASFWFGTVGRLSPVKNQGTLVEAFASVIKVIPDAVLLLAGRGELEATLKEQCRALGVAKNVHFLGYRADIPKVLRCLDCFVFPSLREGLPLSLLEAMASQTPVIATAVGGVPEVFPEQPIGRLVDGVEAGPLVEAMLAIAALPASERHQYGQNGRAHALGQFNSRRMISDYERFFDSLYITHAGKGIQVSDRQGSKS